MAVCDSSSRLTLWRRSWAADVAPIAAIRKLQEMRCVSVDRSFTSATDLAAVIETIARRARAVLTAAARGFADAEAALALGKIGDCRLEDRLIKMVHSPHPRTREAAAMALGQLSLNQRLP